MTSSYSEGSILIANINILTSVSQISKCIEHENTKIVNKLKIWLFVEDSQAEGHNNLQGILF